MKKIIFTIITLLALTGCSSDYTFDLEESVDTIEVFDEYEVLGCSLNFRGDNYKMDISDNPLDTDKVGNYIITYETTVKDKLYTCQRMVFVTDQTKPTVTLNAGIDSVKINTEWIDGGITVTDNYDSTPTVEVESFLVIDELGMYEVVYTVTDAAGNETVVIRTVSVYE